MLPRFGFLAPRIVLALLLVLGVTRRGAATPVDGHTEDFSGTSIDAWGGGGASGLLLDNPGTGGVGGAGDGYLRASLGTDGNFGVRNISSDYTGDWFGANIKHIRLSLNDVGTPDAFEIHVCLGNPSNFWETNVGFIPPNGSWQQFDVDLSSAAGFTQIIGTGTETFIQALQNVTRFLIRHDVPPLVQTPDATHGDLGIDHIVLLGVPVSANSATWGRIKRLYR